MGSLLVAERKQGLHRMHFFSPTMYRISEVNLAAEGHHFSSFDCKVFGCCDQITVHSGSLGEILSFKVCEFA